MTLEDLKRVQEIDTEILICVDKICSKYNIEYFLYYGTLLGCIRHGGPIPWDGDVDIAMTRDNYMKFLAVAPKEIDSQRYLVKLMGSGCPDYITEIKIGRLGTTYCMPQMEHTDIMHNVQLDIFCLDYAKIVPMKQRLLLLKIWGALRLISLNKSEKLLLKKLVLRSDRRFKWLYVAGLNLMHIMRFIVGEKNIEKIGYYFFVDQSRSSGYYTVAGYKSMWPIECFGIKKKEYSNILFPVPSDYNQILSEEYGDYMRFPPENQRYGKYFSEFIFKEEEM